MNEHSKSRIAWDLFITFLKAGTFTFAGGLAMLPLIERSVIEKHHLLSKDEFLECAALSQTLPGVIAVNCACFVGSRSAGVLGALAAVFGAVLPAFVIMLVATIMVEALPDHPVIFGAFSGVRAASAALIFSSCVSLGKNEFTKVFPIIVACAVFVLAYYDVLDILLIILAAGVAGIICEIIRRRQK